ncbi:MAG: DNA helicase [Paracoccaceae bacterium]
MDLSAPIYRLKRQAKTIARTEEVPLHTALDRVAQSEGFASWSHLSASQTSDSPAKRLLQNLQPGELILLAARPGHGKTLLALETLLTATQNGQQAFFFTLDYGPADIAARLVELGFDPAPDSFVSDTSDDICAAYILDRLRDAPRGSLAAVDYMQLLDQRRSLPPLEDQIADLSAGAQRLGVTILLISQISRAYDPQAKPLPDLSDVNLPNPVDLAHFARGCFLQDGKVRLTALGGAVS